MGFQEPFFQINYKLYEETWNQKGLKFAKTAQEVADEFDVTFVLSPQTPDIRLINNAVDLPILAQGMSPHSPGSGLGHILAEAIQEAGADGVMMNHPEHREETDKLYKKIKRCREIRLTSVVCVDSIGLGKAILEWEPDWVIFEHPDLLGTTTSLTETNPQSVREFRSLVEERSPQTGVFLGGGISSVSDVEQALELADATGSASWISSRVDSGDREAILRKIATVLQQYQ